MPSFENLITLHYQTMPNHKEFIKQYAQKMGCDEETAKQHIEGFIEVVFDAMKQRDSLTIEHFGKFYIEDRSDSTVFLSLHLPKSSKRFWVGQILTKAIFNYTAKLKSDFSR